MSEVLQANIFFFVTGIAVIVFTLLFCVALYHVIKVLKSIRRIMDRIESGSEIIADDMMHLRRYFTEGSLISRLVAAFFGERHGSAPRSTRSRTHAHSPKTELTIRNEE